MKQYVMIDVSHCGHGPKLRAFANEVNNFLFVLFSEDDIFAFRKAAFALGLALDERHGGELMQITLSARSDTMRPKKLSTERITSHTAWPLPRIRTLPGWT